MIILANLDCEEQMIQLRSGSRSRALPGRVRSRISAWGTLLRIFANEGDCLLTPAEVPPGCVRRIAGVEEPRLAIAGELPHPDDLRVAWCRVGASAAECNGRAFTFKVASELGLLLPGSQLLHRAGDVQVARFPDAPWIFKAALSVAGRDRVRGQGPQPTPDQVRRIQRLIESQGTGVLEPWMERDGDFGFGSDAGAHALEGSQGGAFQGIRRPAAPLSAAERKTIQRVREAVARALEIKQHQGPWGVDAWHYRDPDGSRRLQPLGEINARMTFGHVARAWFQRVGIPRWGEDASMALRLGERAESDGEDVISLVGAEGAAISYAWLERLKLPVL